jgi:lysophospholipase L1-like esterase
MTKLKTAVFWLFLIFGTFLLIEAVFHLLCLVSPRAEGLLSSRTGLHIHDEKLGWRPNPNFPEHDARGWRNKQAHNPFAVVAMGDSMTYGVWARREDAWPQQLGALGGMKTYNMAFGGYDPTRYLVLADEALELKPKLVIEAVYSGNDLWDAYRNVYWDGRVPELRMTDQTLLQEFSAADKAVPVDDISRDRFEPHRGLKDLLDEHSKIYALLWLSKTMLMPDHTWPWFWIKYRASRFPPWEVLEHAGIRTVLTPSYRLLALDQTDVRIREGLRLSLSAIKRTNDRLSAAGVRFLVLFIPTKELVLEPLMENAGLKDPETLKLLVANEKQVWTAIRDYLMANQIPFVDSLPELQRSVSAGKSPFLTNQDSHPNTEGHRAIAASVLSEIRERKLLE